MENTKTETRNIIQHYWYWETEAIKANLDTKRHNFTLLLSNLYNDFNISTCIRASNAFLAKEVLIYGSKKIDKRGTVGTHLYENIKHVKTIDDLPDFSDSVVVGFDNIDGAIPIETFEWPKDKHVVMVFGQEQVGIPPELLKICNHITYIKQFGSVRSLNVGVACGIACYDYCSKVIK